MAAKAYLYCPIYYYRYNTILQHTYSVFLVFVYLFFNISLHDLQFVKYLTISLKYCSRNFIHYCINRFTFWFCFFTIVSLLILHLVLHTVSHCNGCHMAIGSLLQNQFMHIATVASITGVKYIMYKYHDQDLKQCSLHRR